MSIAFDPPQFEIGSRERITLRFHMGPLLAAGQTIACATAALWDLNSNASYGAGLPTGATSSGTDILQEVGSLVSGRQYRLMIGMTPSGGNTLYGDVILNCPPGWS